jgi:hypothetical protein
MVGRVGFEPTTIGLKDSRLIYQVFINQPLTVFAISIVPVNTRKIAPLAGNVLLYSAFSRM